MKKILTIFLAACLALVVVYVGASYWVGGRAHKHYDELIAQINRSNYLEASIKSYERGLFSSSAVTTFTFVLPEGGDSIKFSIINSIYHGPFVFLENPHLKGGLRPVLAVIQMRLAPGDSGDALKKILEKIPELGSTEILTVLSTDGSGESYIDVPSFQKKFPDDKGGQVEVEWAGLTFKSKYDGQLGEVTGSCIAPSLQIKAQDELLRAKDIRGDFTGHPGIKGVSVGSTAFSVGSIEGSEKESGEFNLTSLGFKAESGASGDTINCSFHFNFDKLNGGGQVLGPFTMEFEVRKLDAEVLSRFQTLVPELRKKAAQKAEGADEEMETLFTGIMVDLLAKSPEFEIKQLKISTDKGDLSGRAKLTFPGPGGNLAANILALISSIDASAELSVSEALFYFVAENVFRDGSVQDPESAKMSASALVMGLIAAKYITLENGSFKSSATYKHGIITVNGQKLDLSNLP